MRIYRVHNGRANVDHLSLRSALNTIKQLRAHPGEYGIGPDSRLHLVSLVVPPEHVEIISL